MGVYAKFYIVIVSAAIFAVCMFMLGLNLDISDRVRGDASQYLSIANSFSSIAEAMSYAGERTYGYPLFLFLVKKLFIPSTTLTWINQVSVVMVLFHIVASVVFWRVFAGSTQTLLSILGLSALLAYPSFILHTTTPLTDTFGADLLMTGFALFFAASKSALIRITPTIQYISVGISGLVLGYSITVRPSYWPALLLFFAMALVLKEFRIKAAVAVIFAILSVSPSFINCSANYGVACIQSPSITNFSATYFKNSISAVRVYWSIKSLPTDPTPGVKDSFLKEYLAEDCQLSSIIDIGMCLAKHPTIAPVYFVKKTFGLFDQPHLQPYAVEQTPTWYTIINRIFSAAAFCGLMVMLVTIKQRLMEPLLILFTFVQIFMHDLLHIEGRYSLSLVPICILALYRAMNVQPRLHKWQILLVVISLIAYLIQLLSWDATT